MNNYLQFEIDKLVDILKTLDYRTQQQEYDYTQGKIAAYADIKSKINEVDERFKIKT